MYLNASTDSIEIILGGTVTANQLQWNVSWQDITSSGMTLPQSAGAGLTNGATLVTMVAAPAASTTRQVTQINVYNADTATATVTIRKDVSGTKYVLLRYALTTLDTLMWSREDGWRVMSATGSGTTYTFSTGLTNTSGTVTNNLSTGVAGGQSVIGGTAASNNLTLSSTTNATKGKILFGTSAYDEVNNRLGIGTASPTVPLEVNGTSLFSDDASFANGKGIILTISGTNRSTKIYQFSTTDNLSQINFYPSSGTNVGQSFSVSPKGTGYSTSIKSQFTVFNTDVVSDPNNYEYITFRAGGTSFNINSGKLNTGTLRPIRLSAGYGDNTTNPDQLWLYITGNIGINTTSDAGYRLDVNGTARVQDNLTISDSKNIILGSTTGNKIGTATSQKIGFWNATPIVQPTTAVAAATVVAVGGTNIQTNDTFDGYTLAQVVKALRNTGILA